MSTFVLDRAYLVEQEDGIPRHRAVVAGSSASHCRLPDGANAGPVLGVTTQPQERDGRAVPVRRFGYASCESAEAIDAGTPVCVADDTGRIRAARPPHALLGTEETNGAVRFVARFPAAENFVQSVSVSSSGSESTLTAELTGGAIEVNLATDVLEEPLTTAAQLATFINEHPVISLVVRAEIAGGDGSAVAATGTVSLTAHEESVHVLGIAQDDAFGEGDLIDVLLLPS